MSDWTAVSDELPQPDTQVLVFSMVNINGHVREAIAVGGYDHDEACWFAAEDMFGRYAYDGYKFDDLNDLDGVTHWMHLPEPPHD